MEGTSIQEHFAHVRDPRVERTKHHQLLAIITIALCGVICGAETWIDIAEFGRAKQKWLETFLELPNGIPSHDTFGRVFARLDPEQFQEAFMQWVQAVNTVLPTQQIALDGKTLRRSHERGVGKAAIHLVSAWATTNRLVLAQVKTAEKSNEITAIPLLLEHLALAGCIVTIDAMGCQTQIAKQIIEQEGQYVLALKGNQGGLPGSSTMAIEGWTRGMEDLRFGTPGPSQIQSTSLISTPMASGLGCAVLGWCSLSGALAKR